MSPRYERVNTEDDEDARDINGNRIEEESPVTPSDNSHSYPQQIPNSPPPSFHSVVGTPDNDSTLEDSFDAPSDDEGEHDMRNLRRSPNNANSFRESIPLVSTTASSSRLGAPSSLTASAPPRTHTPSGRVIGNSNDGVFANISAKPSVEPEKADEQPPTYEQAAADAPPPFWETTIMAPGMTSDEVFIDGLPVGTFFAFIWNAMISMSFQLVGFLLTYLLHTTHAAKNGSRAGLGVTLIQYGFYMRHRPDDMDGGSPPPETEPSDPNNFQFDTTGDPTEASSDSDTISGSEWFAYVFMIVGWFILIRAITDFLRARRTEAVVLASPDRGLGVAIVAENETPDRAV